MTTELTDNVVQFPGNPCPDQEENPHRDVITRLTHVIRQISDLVNAINNGPTTDADKAKFAGCLCSASALCLRAQMEYFAEFIGGGEMTSSGSPHAPDTPPGPSL